MANIDRIAKVDIQLGTAGVAQRSFSDMLILLDYEAPTRFGIIEDADEVLEAPYGLATTSRGYKAVQAAFSQNPGPARVYIGRVDDADASPAATMAAISLENDDWYGFADGTHTEVKAQGYAAWAEANGKLFSAAYTGGRAAITVTNDVGSLLKAGNFFRTIGTDLSEADAFADISIMAKKFATLPGGETWGNQTLAGVPTARLTGADIANLEFRNMNYFTNYRNVSLFRNGKVVAGEWIDIIRFRDWLQEEIRVSVFNTFIDNRVPYTDAGIAIIGQAMVSALDLGVRRGGIVADYPNEKGTGIVPGYTISLPRAANVSNADKRARLLRDVSFRATLQGAIHAAEISGRLIYDTLPSIG